MSLRHMEAYTKINPLEVGMYLAYIKLTTI
jgi:hypothetical protein